MALTHSCDAPTRPRGIALAKFAIISSFAMDFVGAIMPALAAEYGPARRLLRSWPQLTTHLR